MDSSDENYLITFIKERRRLLTIIRNLYGTIEQITNNNNENGNIEKENADSKDKDKEITQSKSIESPIQFPIQNNSSIILPVGKDVLNESENSTKMDKIQCEVKKNGNDSINLSQMSFPPSMEEIHNNNYLKKIIPEKQVQLSESLKITSSDKSFYDFSVDIPSLMSIAKEGWILNYSQQYLAIKNRINESVVLGVLGDFNTGKTFVLSKILVKDIKNIKKSHTKSLCFSYSNNNTVLSIDTKGSNLPINLQSNIEKLENNPSLLYQIKERFIENFVIESSNILLFVMGYASQNQLDKLETIKRNSTVPEIFVIHNLYMLNSLEEVSNYYNEILLPTFQLQKEQINYSATINKDYPDLIGCYFKEKENTENDKNDEEDYTQKNKHLMIHLLFGNCFNSEFDELNEITIKFLQSKLKASSMKKYTIAHKLTENIEKTLKKYFAIFHSGTQIHEIKNKIKIDDYKKIIKFEDNTYSLKLKKVLLSDNICTDEGTYIIKDFCAYKDDNQHLFVQFYFPGEIINPKITIFPLLRNKKTQIKVTGQLNTFVPKNSDMVIIEKIELNKILLKTDFFNVKLSNYKIVKQDNCQIIIQFDYEFLETQSQEISFT